MRSSVSAEGTTPRPMVKAHHRVRPGPLKKSQAQAGWIFALPWILGLLLFFAGPIIFSLYYSFTDYSILAAPHFVGWKNYIALVHDSVFIQSLKVTLYYTVVYVPVSIIIGVAVSMVLNLQVRGQAIFRTSVFVPSLVPVIAIMIIWNWLLNPQMGVVNWLLGVVHLGSPPWFASEHWAMPALVLVNLWTGVGGSTVIYLAGLQDVPTELYDAADVDGAGLFRKALHVTIPLLTPVIFFQLVMGIIGALQQFNLPFLLTNGSGGPNNSLMFYGMYQYITAFSYLKMGYASAQAWIVFLIILVVTAVVFKSQGRWVFYQGKRDD